MRSPVMLVALAGLCLAACTPNDVVNDTVGLASSPRVCPSSVAVDETLIPQGRVAFDPFVANFGVKDSSTPFTVGMVVSNDAGTILQKLPFSGPTTPMIGTHAVPGVKSGPEVAITNQTNLATRSVPFDAATTYKVVVNVSSTDSNFNTANQDCHILTKSFKGTQPVN